MPTKLTGGLYVHKQKGKAGVNAQVPKAENENMRIFRIKYIKIIQLIPNSKMMQTKQTHVAGGDQLSQWAKVSEKTFPLSLASVVTRS